MFGLKKQGARLIGLGVIPRYVPAPPPQMPA